MTRPGRGSSLRIAALSAGVTGAAMVPGPLTAGIARGAARLVGDAHVVRPRGAMAERRAQAAAHMRRIFGPAVAESQLEGLVDRVFASYGQYWADFLRLPHLPASYVVQTTTVVGGEHLSDGLARGNGVIACLPHLGGWEWGGRCLTATGHPLSVVVEALDPPVFAWFADARRKMGMEVISAGAGVEAAALAAIHDNRLLCLLCDRLVGAASGVEVEFFGEKTYLPAGPAAVALRTGATVVTAAIFFQPRADRHQLWVDPPLETPRKGRFREDVAAVTQAVAHRMETLVRRAPTQWHLLQPNWPSD
ncbi:MAG: lysophospholipid acyltransferase family protein, partial [Acidimicrobiales bacterium]